MRTNYQDRKLPLTHFGDKRLIKRYDIIVDNFSSNLTGSIPQASVSKAGTKGTYRFLKNPQVRPEKLLAQTRQKCIEKIDKKGTVLHIMDTVEYDFTTKRSASDLGPMNYVKRRGVYQHNSILLNSCGAALGIYHQTNVIRSDDSFRKAHERKKLPIEQKESYRWIEHYKLAQQLCVEYPELQIITIGDREADMMELFMSKAEKGSDFIIRSKHNRKLFDGKRNLYPTLAQSAVKTTYSSIIIHTRTKKKRKVIFEVRYLPLSIKLYKHLPNKKHLGTCQVYAIEVKEINAPSDIEKPIRWVLLTSLKVDSVEVAKKVIKYYTYRWVIERFHYCCKSGGAKVEDLQLSNSHRILNALTLYSIAAMNVMIIKQAAENEPDKDVYQVGISPLEYKVLYTYAQSKQHIKPKVKYVEDKPPSIKEFAIVLGQISGFLPSKRQEIPGIKILSRAVEKLSSLIDAYEVFNN